MQNFRIFIGLSFAMLTGIATADDSVSYSRDVRPILSQYCFKCHGPDELTRHGGLRLDHPESAYGPGDSEAIAIVPGSVDKSELVRRIESHDADEVMPPPTSKMTLTAAQKDILKNGSLAVRSMRCIGPLCCPRKSNHPSFLTHSGIKMRSTASPLAN